MTEENRKPGIPPGSKNKTNSKKSGKGNKTGKNPVKTEKPIRVGSKVRDEIWAIIIIAFGAFLIVAVQMSAAGAFGEILREFFLGSFGVLAYVLPYYLVLYGILLFLDKAAHISGKSALFMLIIFLMMTLLNSVRFIDAESFEFSFQYLISLFDDGIVMKNGGLFGMFVGTLISKAIGKIGLVIFSIVVILILLLLVLNTPISQFFETMKVKRAAKQADRIAAYEEAERLAQEEAERLAAEKSVPEMRYEKSLKKAEKKSKIMSPAADKEAAMLQAAVNAKEDIAGENSYVPGRMSEGQINIMNYMKDDGLFERSETEEDNSGTRYGLSESDEVQAADSDSLEKKESFSVSAFQNADEDLQLTENLNANVSLEETEKERNGFGAGIKPAAPLYEAEKKLTRKEAEAAMLSETELNLSKEQVRIYKLPSLDLLKKGKSTSQPGAENGLKLKAAKLEDTLRNFHVDAKVVQVTQGPAVTRYEIQPAVGVKVSSIVRLADDIALNLEAKSIRIEAPIPGKAAVGIEVENDTVNMVTLREIVGSQEFKEAKSKISFAVGRDISGASIVGDLKSMPHLLIAGSTGSGKSVCINSIILSILYKAKPEEVKFVLVDPKVVELGNYNGIPHLLIPVVTEPSKAAAALNWAVAEMTERYKKFAEEGVRDLESFNQSVRKKEEAERVMPQVVIIIDELADLMMASPSQVEESICRLAQMARAAGMHLIVATQRPSVDVVTGVIKANIPSRIAFAVSSQVDSRTILDMGGAEKLVGKGDMLYNPLGLGKPIRVQGAFVSDEEVHNVIEFIKGQTEGTCYAGEVIDTIENAGTTGSSVADDEDEFLPDAIELVVHSGQASVSMLQRRFRIGYNRAARIIDMMEARGIVGPPDGSRPRQVLMTETELYALQTGTEEKEEETE